MSFIIGRKLEMTQQFSESGRVVPVTLIHADPNTVTQLRDAEKDGYTAVQLGTEVVSSLKKAQAGHLKDLPQVRTLREFRVGADHGLSRGDTVGVDSFEPGTRVDVTGVSKGRGYAGVMKRHNFAGGRATHGNKDQQRMPGSIASHPQGKVIKGKRMAGRMGNDQVTVKNLEVVSIDPTKNIIAIKGAVPGPRGGLIMIKSRNAKTVWQA
jgi:large subunit ribosomal protein L3